MTNPIFRQRALDLVNLATREAHNASLIDHSGLRGRVREIVVNNLMKPFLPSAFDVGTGKIADSKGFQSRETDLIIYSKAVLPPVLYSERDGVFPVEASFYAIEVKSKVTSEEVDDAVNKANELRKLTYMTGEWDNAGNGISHKFLPIIPALFGFSSDLTAGKKSDLDRYLERDPTGSENPSITAICIAGCGYWWYKVREKQWAFRPSTPAGDEILDFVSGIVNTLPNSLAARRRPRLGLYLMMER